MVDARALDLEEKRLLVGDEAGEGSLRHFREGGDSFGEFLVVIPVDGERQMPLGEGAEQLLAARCEHGVAVGNDLITGLGEIAAQVAFVRTLFGIEESRAAAEDDIHAVQVLAGDFMFIGTSGN